MLAYAMSRKELNYKLLKYIALGEIEWVVYKMIPNDDGRGFRIAGFDVANKSHNLDEASARKWLDSLAESVGADYWGIGLVLVRADAVGKIAEIYGIDKDDAKDVLESYFDIDLKHACGKASDTPE